MNKSDEIAQAIRDATDGRLTIDSEHSLVDRTGRVVARSEDIDMNNWIATLLHHASNRALGFNWDNK